MSTPETQIKNLEKIKQIFNLVQEGISREEFNKSFKGVLDFAKFLGEKNTKDFASIKADLQTLSENLKSEINKTTIDHSKALVNEFIAKIKDEHSARMKAVDDKIKSVKDGKTPTNEELTNLIVPLIPLPLKGEKGDKGEAENLPEVLKRIDLLEKDMKFQKGRTNGGGIVGRDLMKDIDISSQFNGVKTTFNIQAVWYVISVSLSSFPYGALRKGIDYNWGPSSITFLGTLDPATQLSAGQTCIISVVVG